MWWESVNIQKGCWYCWRLAGAEIAVRRMGKFLSSCCRPLSWDRRDLFCTGPVQEDTVFQADLQTMVWDEAVLRAALRPCFAEMPFLINLRKLVLFPGGETTLELELPPELLLIAENGTMVTFRPFELKKTWYGRNTMEGLLCSSLFAPDPAANPQDYTQAAVHCSLMIRNRTKTVVELDKVPLHTGELAIYEVNGKLQSDTPVIDVLGNDFRMTAVRTEQGNLLSPPKNKAGKSGAEGFILQGTRIIKNITGL